MPIKIIDFIGRKYRKVMAKKYQLKLNNTDFSIICNNCWGGHVYRHFSLPYKSPTIGLYLFAEDYLKFIKNIKYYLGLELSFISYDESKYCDELVRKNQLNVPIGKLDDIEIIFLHYKSQKEAYEKWTRRAKRVNYDNLIFKFSEQNLCSEKHLSEFDSLVFNKKVMYVKTPRPEYKSAVYYKGYESEDQILNDTKYYYRDIDLIKIINSPVKQREI